MPESKEVQENRIRLVSDFREAFCETNATDGEVLDFAYDFMLSKDLLGEFANYLVRNGFCENVENPTADEEIEDTNTMSADGF